VDWSDAKLLAALTELANVRDNAGASRFLRRFPDFLSAHYGSQGRASEAVPERKPVKLPFAETIERVSTKIIARTPEDRARHLSELVSEVWWGTNVGAAILFAFLVVDDLTEAVRIAELIRMRGPEESGGKGFLEAYSFLPLVNVLDHLRPAWARRGQFRYEAATILQKALYALWAKSSLAKICKNPECPASFFIARRIQQQYCGDECATPFRLEAKRKWWDKHRKETKRRSTKPQGGKR
jgi:hypothetical protein